MGTQNLCELHRRTAERLGPRVALRHKQAGQFCDLSWADYRRHADDAAAGLTSQGIRIGDRIAILSENRWEWLIADHAILSCGAADVPLHAPLAAAQVEYQVGHSESRGIVVSGQCQADKVFAVLDALPLLEFLVSFEPVISPPDCRLKLLTWDGLKHRGWQLGAAGRQEIARREAAISGGNLATIIYTSGTTGNPKGVMLSHDNLLTNAVGTGKISFMEPDDVLLSWLPYSHIYARTVDHYLTTWAGSTVALAESIETLISDLEAVQPMWLTAVPRFYEKVWNSVAELVPPERDDRLRTLFGPRISKLGVGAQFHL